MLPNAGYLYDHAAFPSVAGPPSFSELPVATYNTEFVPFLGSLFGGGFAANALSLFTVPCVSWRACCSPVRWRATSVQAGG